jgi:hypothetical protein
MLRRFATLLVFLGCACKLSANHAITPAPDGMSGRDASADDAHDSAHDGNQPDDSEHHPDDPDDPDPGDGDDTLRHDGGSSLDADGAVPPDPDPARPSCGSAEFPCVAPEGCTASEFAGHSYFFCPQQVSWDDARASCQAAGSDLLIVDDQAENDFAKSHVSGDTWIGLNDLGTEGMYQWIVPGSDALAGAALDYASWAFAQPDDCALFDVQNCTILQTDGNWNDVSCGDGCSGGPRAYACETY